jgi:hypothetical protein
MPEGHRVFAARSVLDGREHDGSLDAEGTTLIAILSRRRPTDAVRQTHIKGETKARRLCAGFHRR